MQGSELARQLRERLDSISQVVHSLSVFEPQKAESLEQGFTSEVDALVRQMAARISAAADEILEEKALSQEDEDSSGAVHLVMRLKHQADSLMGDL